MLLPGPGGPAGVCPAGESLDVDRITNDVRAQTERRSTLTAGRVHTPDSRIPSAMAGLCMVHRQAAPN